MRSPAGIDDAEPAAQRIDGGAIRLGQREVEDVDIGGGMGAARRFRDGGAGMGGRGGICTLAPAGARYGPSVGMPLPGPHTSLGGAVRQIPIGLSQTAVGSARVSCRDKRGGYRPALRPFFGVRACQIGPLWAELALQRDCSMYSLTAY